MADTEEQLSVVLLPTWSDYMSNILEFIRKEESKTYSENGALEASLEKKYFNYICNGHNSDCHVTSPVLCREIDKFQPFEEAKWKSDKKECARCFKTNNRLLEDIHLKSA